MHSKQDRLGRKMRCGNSPGCVNRRDTGGTWWLRGIFLLLGYFVACQLSRLFSRLKSRAGNGLSLIIVHNRCGVNGVIFVTCLTGASPPKTSYRLDA